METSTVGLLVNRRQSLMDNSAYTISSNFCGISMEDGPPFENSNGNQTRLQANKVCGLEVWLKLQLSKGKVYDLIIRKGSCEDCRKSAGKATVKV